MCLWAFRASVGLYCACIRTGLVWGLNGVRGGSAPDEQNGQKTEVGGQVERQSGWTFFKKWVDKTLARAYR